MFRAIQALGTGIKFMGAALIAAMMVVGTVAIDLVLLAFLVKESRRRHNSFLTGYLFGSMFSGPTPVPNPFILFVLSPILTAIAVGLSVALEVPTVGLALLAGWSIAISAVAVGFVIENIGKGLSDLWRSCTTRRPKPNNPPAYQTQFNSSFNPYQHTAQAPQTRRTYTPYHASTDKNIGQNFGTRDTTPSFFEKDLDTAPSAPPLVHAIPVSGNNVDPYLAQAHVIDCTWKP